MGAYTPLATFDPRTLFPNKKVSAPMIDADTGQPVRDSNGYIVFHTVFGCEADSFDRSPFINPITPDLIVPWSPVQATHCLAVISHFTSPPYTPGFAGQAYLSIWFLPADLAQAYLAQSVGAIIQSEFGRLGAGQVRGTVQPGALGINSQNSIPWQVHLASEQEFRSIWGG